MALAALAALLAGCAGSPAPAPGDPPAAAAQTGDAAAGSEAPDESATANPPSGGQAGGEPAPADSGAAGEPVASDPSSGRTTHRTVFELSVPAPALSDLPGDLRTEVGAVSAWEAAQRAALWLHGAELVVPLTVAPALQDQLAPFRQADARQVWVRLADTQETEEAFSFHVQVIRRDGSGRLELAGDDEVVVSLLEGGAPLVTGYAHAAGEASDGEVAVWAGAGPEDATAPELLDLPAPVLTDGSGDYQVPVAALAALGEVERQEEDGTVVLVLGDGSRTAALAVTAINGEPYVRGSELEAAVDGVRVTAPDSSYAYAVEWRPDLGQLGLWRAVRRPIS